MTQLTQKQRDDYEEFLVEIDMLLDDLGELLANSKNYADQKVAYDNDSLNAIERFYIEVLQGKEKVSVSPARMNRIILAYYGEAFRERVGATWELCKHPGNRTFGLPVVRKPDKDIPFSPVHCRDRQVGDHEQFLVDTIEYAANQEVFERDLFKEFEK